MNNRKQNMQPVFAEVNLTGDEFQKSPGTFFGVCKVKGKNPERWLAYGLDHIGSAKDYYNNGRPHQGIGNKLTAIRYVA